MRNLLRKPLTWMVIAECIVITALMVVIWNVVAAAAMQHAATAPVQAVDASPGATTRPLPDLTEGTKATAPAHLPGLNLDSGFWRLRLGQLNRDQVFFEQLEWNIVHSAMDVVQRYLETVVLPSITRAERRVG
jgi:hypothetical protein